MMVQIDKLIKHLKSQIATAEHLESDWVYITKREAEACLELADALKEQEAEIEQLNRFVNGFSRDAVPVVRCKDCKWFIKKFESEGRCIKHDNDYHAPDWFCADGERRTDGHS